MASLAVVHDHAQNTFVALIAARDRFRGASTFLTYALGVAHNVLRTYYRGLAHQAESIDS